MSLAWDPVCVSSFSSVQPGASSLRRGTEQSRDRLQVGGRCGGLSGARFRIKKCGQCKTLKILKIKTSRLLKASRMPFSPPPYFLPLLPPSDPLSFFYHLLLLLSQSCFSFFLGPNTVKLWVYFLLMPSIFLIVLPCSHLVSVLGSFVFLIYLVAVWFLYFLPFLLSHVCR